MHVVCTAVNHHLPCRQLSHVLLCPAAGWLLVLITAGAVACSVVWEKRLWCRYLCPIGEYVGAGDLDRCVML